jgi:hypothetical protein
VERDWLDGQVAEKEAWLAAGQCEQAIQRLEALAAAYPQSEAVAGKLAQSREGARLAGLCAGMQQLWAQARAQAEEIQAADPHYPDPDGLLRQLLEETGQPAVSSRLAAGADALHAQTTGRMAQKPSWVRRMGLSHCLIALGGLSVLLSYLAYWAVVPTRSIGFGFKDTTWY